MLRKSLSFVLILWFLLGLLKVGYYYLLVLPSEFPLLLLSEEEKRKVQFGEEYSFFKKVNSYTPENSNMLFLTDNGKIYFSGRYFVYPRKVTLVESTGGIIKLLKRNLYTHIIVFYSNKNEERKTIEEIQRLKLQNSIEIENTLYTKNGTIIKI